MGLNFNQDPGYLPTYHNLVNLTRMSCLIISTQIPGWAFNKEYGYHSNNCPSSLPDSRLINHLIPSGSYNQEILVNFHQPRFLVVHYQ